MTVRILHGETPGALADIPDGSIDACVTDPPYGIGFMGNEWDTFKPGTGKHRKLMHPREREARAKIVSDNPNINGRCRSPALSPSQIEYDRTLKGQLGFQEWTELWAREVYRVLKPGGHLLCSGAPRSYHRAACGIEDAGFEVRDAVLWLFGQGFPKSHNLKGDMDGWGTALKPAWEPIVLARKPFKGTVAENAEQHGTGALNIDACRVPVGDAAYERNCSGDRGHDGTRSINRRGATDFRQGGTSASAAGRWPANVIHDGSDCVVAGFPAEAGALAPDRRRNGDKFRGTYGAFSGNIDEAASTFHGDTGSAARFFYCAKASRADRDDGMAGFEKKPLLWSSGEQSPGTFQSPSTERAARNFHPTVKPTDLMRYLCALVTPPDGTILDPFMGSGSTGRGAILGGFNFIGVEREAEYVEIARARIRAIAPLFADEQQGMVLA